jgi:hypothetical protein
MVLKLKPKGVNMDSKELATADKIRLIAEAIGVVLAGIAFAVEAVSKKE